MATETNVDADAPEESNSDLENIEETVIKTSVSNNEEKTEEVSETTVSVSEENSEIESVTDEYAKEKFKMGKYEGLTMEEVYKKDPEYFPWMFKNMSSSTKPKVKETIDVMIEEGDI
jgi:hypothetical protein